MFVTSLFLGFPVLYWVSGFLGLMVIYMFFNPRRPKNAPPNAYIGLPFIGNYINFASNPVKFVEDCMNKFGCIYTVPMLHKKLTFLIGPEVSEPFFALDDSKMSQSEVYGFMTPVFGKGVVYDAPLEKRTQQMHKMSTALKSANLMAYISKIEKECIEYFKKWGETGQTNLLDALSELTILTSSRCLHGDDVREQLFDEVARIYHDLDKGVTPISFFFPYAPIPAHTSRDNARKEMVNIFSKVIAARREKQIGQDTSQCTDLLQVFMDLVYKDGTKLSDDEIVGLLIALLFAGQHTSSISSTWTTMFLIHNQRCLEKVMKEQEDLLQGDLSKQLDFDLVGKMGYLNDCIRESLRMHPPLILLMRMAMEDIPTKLDGKEYIIPKGDIVVTSPAVASRLKSVFTNPNDFEPERFHERKEDQQKDRRFTYLGFGGGRHACLGQTFGLLQVKTIVSVLLRNFEIIPVDKEFPEPDYTAMVVGPKNHCMVNYKKKAGAFI